MSSGKNSRRRGGHPARVAERRERDRQRREQRGDPLVRLAAGLARDAATLRTALDAELWASALLGTWWPPRPFEDESPDLALGGPLVEKLARIGDAGALAALRAIGEVSESELGLLAVQHAEKLEAGGVAPPTWGAAIREAEILHTAILREDVFDDGITVFVEARHAGEEPHAIGVYIDHNLGGIAKDLLIADSIALVEELIGRDPDGQVPMHVVPVSAQEACARIHDAMALTDMTLGAPVGEEYAALRALALLRADELPGPPSEIERPQMSAHARDRLRDDFLAAREGAGFTADSDEAFIASLAIDYCCDYVDGRPLRWSPVVVELFMTDWLPRKVLADRATFEAVPTALAAWVRYVGRERGIPDWAIAKTTAAIGDYTAEMLDRFDQPGDRGPTAEFLKGAKDSGIDLADHDALAKFIAGWNARSQIDAPAASDTREA